jgi:hypothetical protein
LWAERDEGVVSCRQFTVSSFVYEHVDQLLCGGWAAKAGQRARWPSILCVTFVCVCVVFRRSFGSTVTLGSSVQGLGGTGHCGD